MQHTVFVLTFQVNLAAQVCSHTVYAGMRTLVALGQLDANADMTAVFLKSVNDLFDLLNVRVCGSGIRPLTRGTYEQCRLQKLQQEVLTWKVTDKGAPSRPPCFDGFVQAINVALLLREELVMTGRVKFLLTGRMNQDSIENLFSQIRSKGGHRYNPSSKDFRYAYRNLSCQMLLVPVPSANCSSSTEPLLSTLMRMPTAVVTEADTCVPSQSVAHVASQFVAPVPSQSVAHVASQFVAPVPSQSVAPVYSQHETEALFFRHLLSCEDFEVPSPVSNVLCYIAGYLVTKLGQIECTVCIGALQATPSTVVSEQELFTHFKAFTHNCGPFGPLSMPSKELFQCLKLMHSIFLRCIHNLMTECKISQKMKFEIRNNVTFHSLQLCNEHRMQVIDFVISLFVRCRLHYYLKFETQKLLQKLPRKNRKANCVLHK